MDYYSDFSTLINLVLVTVLYSTLIAPSLKKLSDLREEVADTNFPNSEIEDYEQKFSEASTTLKKKLTQYTDKYRQTRNFLWFFYGILIAIFGSQALLLLVSDPKNLVLDDYVKLGIAILIVAVLTIAIELFMTRPGKIKSLQWLTNHGIVQAFYRRVFDGRLILNLQLYNLTHDRTLVEFMISSGLALTGYGYVLIVQSLDGKKLYYSSWGQINNATGFGLAIADRDGTSRTLTGLTRKFCLKPGTYKVELLLFEAPFRGTYHAHETKMIITDVNELFETQDTPIAYNGIRGSYEFSADKQSRIKSVAVSDDGTNDATQMLLLSKKFLRYFSKAKRPFSIESQNGTIDKHDIENALKPLNIFIKKILYKFERHKDKKTTVVLMKRK